MKRIIRVLIIVILLLGLYQVGSYFLYSKTNLEVCYFDHFNPLIKDINKLHIYTTSELKAHESEKIKEILKSRYSVVELLNDTAMSYKYDQEVTMIRIEVDYELPFHAVVYEYLKTDDYIEVWRSELDWLLGKWVLRHKINIGQS